MCPRSRRASAAVAQNGRQKLKDKSFYEPRRYSGEQRAGLEYTDFDVDIVELDEESKLDGNVESKSNHQHEGRTVPRRRPQSATSRGGVSVASSGSRVTFRDEVGGKLTEDLEAPKQRTSFATQSEHKASTQLVRPKTPKAEAQADEDENERERIALACRACKYDINSGVLRIMDSTEDPSKVGHGLRFCALLCDLTTAVVLRHAE